MATNTIFIPVKQPVTDKGRIATPEWQIYFNQLSQQASAAGPGDVVQDGTVTVGHLATWSADKHIEDGGAVPVGGITQLTSDVTAGPGSGSQAATIAAHAVTFAKTQQISTQRLVGRDAAGTGDEEEVTISQALDWLGP